MIANSTTELCALLPRRKDKPKLTPNMCFFATPCNVAGPWRKATYAFLAPALLVTVRPQTGEAGKVKSKLSSSPGLSLGLAIRAWQKRDTALGGRWEVAGRKHMP